MGVVIGLDRDMVRVLDQNRQVKLVQVREITKKQVKNPRAQDSKGNNLMIGDSVQVMGEKTVIDEFILASERNCYSYFSFFCVFTLQRND